MELYQSYLKELQDVHKAIAEQISELTKSCDTSAPNYSAPPTSGPASRNARITAITELINRGKDCASNMEIEANDVIPAERLRIRQEIQEHRKRLSRYDFDITNLKTQAKKAEREDLLKAGKRITVEANEGIPDDLDEESKKERMAMAAVTTKQQGNTDIMRNIERIAVQSANTIKEAEGELRKQRETVQDIHEKTREMDSEVSDARRVANQMHKVMVQNKAVLLGIIALLVIMIIVIVYVKAVGSGSNATTTTTIVNVLPTSPVSGGDGSGSGGLDA